jgi:predicted O-methyltransferase YrrM
MNIEQAKTISGWMEEEELEWLADQASKHTNIVEIGSWMGRSTRALADNTNGRVTAVDAWDSTIVYPEMQETLKDKPEGWLLSEFKRNLEGTKSMVFINQNLSVRAAVVYRDLIQFGLIKFDMIFIDATHTYEAVKADNEAWLPLLAEGGLICGHDFGWPGVHAAVMECLPNATAAAGGNIWQVGAK